MSLSGRPSDPESSLPARPPFDDSELSRLRAELVSKQLAHTTYAHQRPVTDPRVLRSIGAVPREEFVPEDLRQCAYEDRALPIDCGQTISQPYMVGIMTELLEPRPTDVMLEVGTGCGYQAAVLSLLIRRLYSIEAVPQLAASAVERLARLGFDNIRVRDGDGRLGWPEHAPFDGIIVTAAGRDVPLPLVEQLKPGRRLVIPVGKTSDSQELLLIEKGSCGKVQERSIMPVRFVALVGGPES